MADFFLRTVDFPEGLSEEDFLNASDADKVSLMVQWFLANYEDPANETPFESREGGYQWIWGGPYDANEEIGNKFYRFANEDLIVEAVEEVETRGILEWAPVTGGDEFPFDRREEEFLENDFLSALNDVPDNHEGRYGSASEIILRRDLIERIELAVNNIDSLIDKNIGHNNPPDSIYKDTNDEIRSLRNSLEAIGVQLKSDRPSCDEVKKNAFRVSALMKSFSWVGGKLDLAVDVSIKFGIPYLIYHRSEIAHQIYNIFQSVVSWLQIVT